MSEAILTLNIGSSSVKASLREAARDEAAAIWSGDVGGVGTQAHIESTTLGVRAAPDLKTDRAAVERLFEDCRKGAPDAKIVAVGHRIVHGGARFSGPVLIDDAAMAALVALSPLAPSHQPHNLMGVEAARAAFPHAPQIACFDTAFHRTMPEVERLFALPRRYAEQGVVRYGFHGLSYAYIAGILPEHLGETASGRVIVAHLGAGASLCAMRERKSVATTMGFTALDGPPMSTRSGSIDPGVILHLIKEEGMAPGAVSDLLYHQSGLLGVSGISGDMKTLLESSDVRAREAVDLFVYRVAREIGALAAAIGGLDALVFTAGIGENSPEIRARVTAQCKWIGAEIDAGANERAARCISTPTSRISVWAIPTDEEREIARETRNVFARR
ncbi:MAG TPA: acetate/propionate family kinase [Parvularculaceae bacterium]|nr:acetate/propionate family kinase [Parvularculaceae bacterium]